MKHRDIPGLEGKYSVPPHGEYVWSNISNKRLAIVEDRYGYLRVGLNGRPIAVHILVMLTWGVDQPSKDHQIHHIDEDKHNNHIENLAWMTIAENTGYSQQGERNYKSKWTDEFVQDVIFELLSDGYSCAAIARQLECGQTTIHNIKIGKTWKHLKRPWE